MSEHSNMNRTAAVAEDSFKYDFHRLLNFLTSPAVEAQLNRQGQRLNVREVVKLYGIVYGSDLDLSNVITGGQTD